MNKVDKVVLLFNTVRNLKPVQIRYQLLKRLGKRKVQRHILTSPVNPVSMFIPELDDANDYLERFDINSLVNDNIVTLLHEKHELNSWEQEQASHLWNYNLQYLEFTVPLAVKYKTTEEKKYKDKWIEIVTSWLDNAESENYVHDDYGPYTISMRIPNLLIGMECIDLDEELNKRICVSIYNQYRFLQDNVELRLLANHYFENLKTLVIGSVLFGDTKNYHKYFSRFLQQIDEQILPDGLHYERSLMYHKIILEDIIRVYVVLKAAGKNLDAEKLVGIIKLMADALGSIEKGIDQTPFFNDAGNNVSKDTQDILKVCEKITVERLSCSSQQFPYAGYYRLEKGDCCILFDCGDVGPGYMGGHAHNDCLSFEMNVRGRKVFTNSGTGMYQGELRHFFRSTAAHNILMVDDHEQSELWGEHRVGRRAVGFKAELDAGGNAVTGEFQSYDGIKYKRGLKLNNEELNITDQVLCKGQHILRQFFHLVPGLKYIRGENGIGAADEDGNIILQFTIPGTSDYLIHTEGAITNFAEDFGLIEHKQVLEIRTPFKDKARIEIVITGEVD